MVCVSRKVGEVWMSDTCKKLWQVVCKEVVVKKTCDVCLKEIPPTSNVFPRKNIPYFNITTHHSDWGNDSIDSYENYHACCPECAMKFVSEYLERCFDGNNTEAIEIEHVNGWFLPKEEVSDA